MTFRVMSLTNRESQGVLSLRSQALVMVALIVLFAFIGPFGTYNEMGPVARAGYWSLTLGVNWLVCGSVVVLVLRAMGSASALRRLAAATGASFVAAVPGTGVVYTVEMLFRPGDGAGDALATIYLSVAVVMAAISALAVLLSATGVPLEGAPETDRAGTDPARFLARLPDRLGRDLVCLKMADHYVEAVTTAGATLILMRFADALAELEEADGLRVHRSHWVARRHVTGCVRRNGRTILKLTGGHEAPVSRAYLTDVRAAGLV